MSRIGKKPIPVPANVKVAVNGNVVEVVAGGNKLALTCRPEVTVRFDEASKSIIVERKDDQRVSRAMHGMTRAMLANMVVGVTQGFSKELEVNGVGWTARVQGATVQLNVGFADTRVVAIPAGVKVEITQNRIKVSGADRQQVGQVAAQIRSQRPPEPYNGKGIKYSDERIVRKQGKAFAGGGA